jgi:hypothetical protein
MYSATKKCQKLLLVLLNAIVILQLRSVVVFIFPCMAPINIFWSWVLNLIHANRSAYDDGYWFPERHPSHVVLYNCSSLRFYVK